MCASRSGNWTVKIDGSVNPVYNRGHYSSTLTPIAGRAVLKSSCLSGNWNDVGILVANQLSGGVPWLW